MRTWIDKLRYDKKTGDLIWKNYRGREGKVAGTLKNGYVSVQLGRKQYLAHRLIWFINYGYFPESFIDHINRDKTDNRIENLREVTNQCNQRNSNTKTNKSSGIRGVSFDKGYWLARIKVDDKVKHVGCSKDLIEAVAFRLAAEQSLNWSGCDSTSPAYLKMREYLCELG